MEKYIEELGELILAAVILFLAMGLLSEALSADGGFFLLVKSVLFGVTGGFA